MAKALTKNQKIGITAAVIIVLAGVGYGIYRVLSKDERDKKSKDPKHDKAGLDAALVNGSVNPTNELASFDPNTPPNGCVTNIITDSDGDYNYAWCSNQWWTISKQMPVKGMRDIPNWISLQSNLAATDVLNRKHPNRA